MMRADKTASRPVQKRAITKKKHYRIVATNLAILELQIVMNLSRPVEFNTRGNIGGVVRRDSTNFEKQPPKSRKRIFNWC